MLFDTQAEREALINLMLVARFSDKKLSIAEEETFTTILNKVHWEDVVSSESFVNEQLSVVREVIGSMETLLPFVTRQCAHFTQAEAKQLALQKVANVLHSDGLVESEQEVYNMIANLLNKS